LLPGGQSGRSGVADEFSDDGGDVGVAVGVEFGDEFGELAAGDPGEPTRRNFGLRRPPRKNDVGD
jgi:hypothetical protein